ncbi:hypothetical protein OSTOST_17756 [Ostertagia ostertagi]
MCSLRKLIFFGRKFGSQFKGYEEIFVDSSFVFTNANPYLDYPRPMLHKTVPIGGVAVKIDSKKKVLTKILFRINNIRLFMPETTFIWKYEEEGSQIAAYLKNVYLRTWVPQIALLEIPVFADQIRNAQMLAKHGGGIVLSKSALEHPEEVRSSLESILHDESIAIGSSVHFKRFTKNAKRLSEMLLNQPVSAKQLLIKHSEFAARFGRLPNLDPYGRHLSFIEYYLIDIFLAVLGVIIVVALVVYKISRRIEL